MAINTLTQKKLYRLKSIKNLFCGVTNFSRQLNEINKKRYEIKAPEQNFDKLYMHK